MNWLKRPSNVDQMDAVVVRDVASAEQASSLYPNHHKIQSWLLLRRLGLPTLPGIILDHWSPEIERQVRQFATSMNVDALLVRSDKAPESGDYPPAGDLAAIGELGAVALKYLKKGRVLFLLEPRSRFEDLYSLSIGFRSPLHANVEIVGPGFDASDLKRGDASPHEWFDVRFEPNVPLPVITNRSVIAPRAYRRSWEQRLSKVGRLVTGDYPSSTRPVDADARIGATWLSQHNLPLLLENRKRYAPIPEGLLSTTLDQCAHLPQRLAELDAGAAVFVVSLSFIGRDADQVYWDIVWPATKFDIRKVTLGADAIG